MQELISELAGIWTLGIKGTGVLAYIHTPNQGTYSNRRNKVTAILRRLGANYIGDSTFLYEPLIIELTPTTFYITACDEVWDKHPLAYDLELQWALLPEIQDFYDELVGELYLYWLKIRGTQWNFNADLLDVLVSKGSENLNNLKLLCDGMGEGGYFQENYPLPQVYACIEKQPEKMLIGINKLIKEEQL